MFPDEERKWREMSITFSMYVIYRHFCQFTFTNSKVVPTPPYLDLHYEFLVGVLIKQMDKPAHEEEDKGNDAKNADDHGDSNEDSRGPEGGGENCPEIIQTTAADLSPVLAEITKILIFFSQQFSSLLLIHHKSIQIKFEERSLGL